MPKLTVSFPKAYFYAVAALTAAGCVIWQLLCPWCVDDLAYSLAAPADGYSDFGFWHFYGEDYRTAGEIWESFAGHVRYSNARLTNLIYILVQLAPLWVVKMLCGLLTAGMYLGLLLMFVPSEKRGNPWLVTLATLLFWCVFNWNDFMQSSDFIFNYPLSTVAVVVWLYYYRRTPEMGRSAKAAFLVWTFIVATLHEAFTISLGAYVFFDWLLNRRRRSWAGPASVAVMVAVVLAVLWLGTGKRFDKEHFFEISFFQFLVWDGVAAVRTYAPCFVAFALYAWASFSGRREVRRYVLKEVSPYVLASMTGVAVALVLHGLGRVAWAPELFAFMAIVLIAARMSPAEAALPPALKLFFVSAGCAYAFWLSELCVWQYKATASTHAVYASMAPRGSMVHDIVYVDSIFRKRVPFYLMDIPSPILETKGAAISMTAEYYTRCRSSVAALVPEKYRGLPIDSIPVIPGNAGMRGEVPFVICSYPYAGHLRIYGGEYGPGHNPLSPLVTKIKKRIFGGESNRIEPWVSTTAVMAPDSTLWYFFTVPQIPLSFRNREIVAVDTTRNEWIEVINR